MRRVTAREANQNFSKILAEAESGETFVITKLGQEVATIGPIVRKPAVRSPEEIAQINAFFDRMREGVEFTDDEPFDRDAIYDR